MGRKPTSSLFQLPDLSLKLLDEGAVLNLVPRGSNEDPLSKGELLLGLLKVLWVVCYRSHHVLKALSLYLLLVELKSQPRSPFTHIIPVPALLERGKPPRKHNFFDILVKVSHRRH